MARRRSETSTGVLHALGVGLSLGLLSLVILLAMAVIVVPAVAGATPLTVLTSSMEPKLPPGTLVVVSPLDHSEIELGDVITYQIESGKAGVVTHRVIGVSDSSDGSRTFTTKGDNNDLADELPVLPVQIMGKVWYSVPWIGHVSAAINGDARSWLVPAIAIALLVYAGYMVASGLGSNAKKRRLVRERERERQLAKADEVFGRTSTGSAGVDKLDPQAQTDQLNRAAPVYQADQL